MTNAAGILYKEESYKIIGACMKVHRILGPGFLESVYQEALQKEFQEQKIPFEQEVKLNVYYNGQRLNKFFKADFLCHNKIVLEVKAVSFLPPSAWLQLRNYLVTANKDLGILINFGESSLKYKRIVNTQH